MADKDNLAHRLALLGEVELSPVEVETITHELEDLQRIMAELEEFAQVTPWISSQIHPADEKS